MASHEPHTIYYGNTIHTLTSTQNKLERISTLTYTCCVYTHKHKLKDQLQITEINQGLYHQVGVRIPVVHSTRILCPSSPLLCKESRSDMLSHSLSPSLSLNSACFIAMIVFHRVLPKLEITTGTVLVELPIRKPKTSRFIDYSVCV